MADQSIVEDWLKSLYLGQYAESFLDNGYDDLEICKQIGEPDLDAIGVTDAAHRQQILQAVRILLEQGGTSVYFTLDETLQLTPGQDSADSDGTKPTGSSVDRLAGKAAAAANSYGGYGYTSDVLESPVLTGRKYVDEYEEGKAQLVKFPKIQLKMMIRDKLVRDNIRLSAQPYSNHDGSRGNLETLAVQYTEELRTHYHDVIERLDELRRRRVAIDFPPLPVNDPLLQGLDGDTVNLKPPQNFKPGKYSPSSCLSDHEEASIYGLYQGPPTRSNKSSPPRCLSPRSRYFYEPCPFPSADSKDSSVEVSEQAKKRSGLGKLFRSLGSRKGSPRHSQKAGTWKLSSYGSQKRLAEVFPGDLAEEERLQLTWMMKEGYLSMDQACNREKYTQCETFFIGIQSDSIIEECEEIRQNEKKKKKGGKYTDRNEVLAELGRAVMWSPSSGKKNQSKCKSVFYSDIPTSNSNHSYYHSTDESWSHDYSPSERSCPQSRVVSCSTAPSPRAPCWTFSPSKHPPPTTLETGPKQSDVKVYSHEEFTSAILARTHPLPCESHSGSKTGEDDPSKPTVCGGECGNIMCSVSAMDAVEATSPVDPSSAASVVDPDGDTITAIPSPGDKRRSATSCGGGSGCSRHSLDYSSVQRRRTKSEGCCSSTCSVRSSMEPNRAEVTGEYASSPVLDRKSKGSVLGRFRIIKQNRSSCSTSEEGHSSDCEEQEETERKTVERLSRESSGHSASSWTGRVRDLHKGVKQKFSKLRNSRGGVGGENESSHEVSHQEVIHAGSSMESIQSGSDSRSSPHAHTPTSSNCSSASTGEEEPSVAVGAILGRARALVDYTPSPYDKDALAFRKGDIIDIIDKSNTGQWIGRVHGQVGHFKFINVEELSTESRRSRRFGRKVVEDSTITTDKPHSLDDLMRQLGLQDYMNVLVLNGYNNLETFKELEAEDLISLGILNPDHQLKLLRAADALDDESSSVNPMLPSEELCSHDADSEQSLDRGVLHKQSPRDSGCYASNENLIQREAVHSVPSNGSLLLESADQDISQSESGIQSSEGPDSTTTINNLDLSASSSVRCDTVNYSEDIILVPGDLKKDDVIANCELNIPPSHSSDRLSSGSNMGLEEGKEICYPRMIDQDIEIKTSRTLHESKQMPLELSSIYYEKDCKRSPFSTFAAELEMALANGMHDSSQRNSRGKVPPPVPKRTTPSKCYMLPHKFIDGHTISQYSRSVPTYYSHHHNVDPMDHRASIQDSPTHVSCASVFAKRVKSATLPRKRPQEEIPPPPQNPVEIYVSVSDKKSLKKSGHRKGSLQPPSKNPRPPSLSLLTAVSRKLDDENIDLCQDPYTDKTGFCGIPPALVQRYAEELHRDVYDVAEALDQARINKLQQRGCRGVPNDFLADSCSEPVVEANYTNMSSWLISLGLPMYETTFRRAGCTQLYQIARMRDTDLRACGINNARHIRLLTAAIGALHIYLGHFGAR